MGTKMGLCFIKDGRMNVHDEEIKISSDNFDWE